MKIKPIIAYCAIIVLSVLILNDAKAGNFCPGINNQCGSVTKITNKYITKKFITKKKIVRNIDRSVTNNVTNNTTNVTNEIVHNEYTVEDVIAKRVGAMTAALSSMPFRGDSVAVGLGQYQGITAISLGLQRGLNSRTTVRMNVSATEGEVSAGLGLSYEF